MYKRVVLKLSGEALAGNTDKNFDNAYIFSHNRKGYSTIFTNLSDTWLRLGA